MLVSLTIVRYKNILIPAALLAMAIHRIPLYLDKKCRFWKLMGCGKNGFFDLRPDLNQWALLAVWDSQADFEHFRSNSFIAKWWRALTEEQYTILCKPLTSHGRWDNKEPFGNPAGTEAEGAIAVLTRATIRFRRLRNFWKHVPKVSETMQSTKGYITSFGIGEAPFYLQATFSVWESLDDVKAFAYRSPQHSDVIRKTRDENWYSEELFARFKPLATFGSINGADPLKDKI